MCFMRLPFRTLVLAAVLFAPRLSVAQPTTADSAHQLNEYDRRAAEQQDYAEQLKEYDRRVAEQKAFAEQDARTRWLPLGIILGVLLVYLIYSHVVARRRFQAQMERSRPDIDRMLQQNQRMIELLESIDRKMNGPGT